MEHYETSAARILHTLCEQIAAEQGLNMQSLCEGWVIRLSRGELKRLIYGHNFELNSAAARNIASDKAAAAAVLTLEGVPCVEHHHFSHPEISTYVDPAGNWHRIRELAEQWNWSVVLKPVEGSGGHSVTHTITPRQLEAAVHRLFATERGICISPFQEAKHEHRVVVLDGEVELMYSKSQPALVGDGERTLVELLLALYESHADGRALMTALAEDDATTRHDWRRVPDAGERVLIGWKHNLRLAGNVETCEREDVPALALRAADAINLRFGAVDVLESDDGLRVLEVNSGFMATHFARLVSQGERIVKRIYEKAILRMFEVKPEDSIKNRSERESQRPD